MALEVQRELETRFNEADKLRKQQVQRAEYEANLARRRFMTGRSRKPTGCRYPRGGME